MPRTRTFKIPDAAKRMRDAILAKDINMTDLAKETHLARNTICEFIYHGRDISSEKLRRLCMVVGVSADYILGMEKEDVWLHL